MPNIASRLVSRSSLPNSGVRPNPLPRVPGPILTDSPTLNTMLRCPLPNITSPSPDNLRQFYAGGRIPQYRMFQAPPLSANSTAPVASTSVPGTVIADGKTIAISKTGVISVITP